MSHQITFVPSGRGKAQCAPNPEFPDGVALNVSDADPKEPHCLIALAYPAPECGVWLIKCDQCELALAVTAAGRPDDPRSIRVKCEK